MTLSIKNGGYAFLIRFDLMFSMPLWKEFQLFQILNDQRQHCVLQNLRKNKDIVITKSDKGNGVVILDRKLYNNTIEEII